MKNQKIISDVFFQTDGKEWENVDQGVSRQFVGYDTQIMMVKVKFETGAVGYEHQHFHAQTTYVASGKFRVTIDGEERVLSEGDGFYIPPNVLHGAVCLEAGMLIDVFSPVREDFLDINFLKK
ncbi:cupin domain-containing protein [Sinomicrobium pectinilyticum]|uniref:Cupin domain-containing protein n=1 Tax=Sinomicrobium pectinilyticum TaxID=1084421 RepID=A0A3N0EGV7_SINP1|nr:cupin domain-containing protein [Sinomicrobium pectinilyticum]RNL87108.1 cupin domain-containing protein [Sinomicrobium pectinilyticum]